MSKSLDSTLKRPVMSGEIPAKARVWPTDIEKFKMRPPTLGEELDAAKAAQLVGGTQKALDAEVLRRVVFEIDGKPASDNLDWLDEQSPQVRAYLKVAWAKLENDGLDAGELDDFVKNLTTTVG